MNAKEFAERAAKSTTRIGLAGLIRNRLERIIELEGLIRQTEDPTFRDRQTAARDKLVEEMTELHAQFLNGGVR